MVSTEGSREAGLDRPLRLLGARWPCAVPWLLTLSVLTGCATLPNGRGWGQDVTLSPGWQKVRRSAAAAVLAPETWVPLTTALLLQIDDMDARVSRWAAGQTPVFGSCEDASRASDDLRFAAACAYALTTVATPSGKKADDWLANKLKGVAVGIAAHGLTYETVRILKAESDRTRPDLSNDQSFPSGHASSAAVYATLAARNVESLPVSRGFQSAMQTLCAATAVGCAWARVEGRKHYPSDVLTGLALGHFFGAFVTDAFLGLSRTEDVTIGVVGNRESVAVWLDLRF